MTCSNYNIISPSYWSCSIAKAAIDGLGDGASEQAAELSSKVAESVEKGLGQASSKLTDTATAFFENASQMNFSKFGANAGQNIYNFTKSFVESSGAGDGLKDFDVHNLGQNASTFLNEQANGFIKGLNLRNLTMQTGDEASAAWDDGFQNINMTQRIHNLREEVTPAIDEFFEAFRENTINQMDNLREDIQKVIANGTRDSVLEILPWALLGIALTAATPLAVLYGYHRLKHNIGKPKLIQERNSANYFDKISGVVTETVKGAFNSALGFTKGYLGVGVLIATASMIAGFASKGKCMFDNRSGDDEGYCFSTYRSEYFKPSDSFIEPVLPQNFASDVICGVAPPCQSIDASDPALASRAFYLCLGAGLLVGGYRASKQIYGSISKWFVKSDQPIFEPKVKSQIDDITSATLNIKKHGGYFENLLLFGPGGTGKTMISKYIARNSNLNYVIMSGGDLAQHIKRGEHVTELNKLFGDVNDSMGPTIIFIDEAEALCKNRDQISDNEHMELISAFLNQTGEQSKKFMLILATNRLQDIDPAVLSRMDHKVNIEPPKKAEREKIISLNIPKLFTSSEISKFFTKESVEKIASQTEGLTGRDLAKMLNSLANKKNGSKDNKLTVEMIQTIVKRFVEQDRVVKAKVAAAA